MLLKSILLLFTLSILPLSVCGQSIKGKIIIADDKTPVAGATIIARSDADSTLYHSVMSDVAGKFRCAVPMGSASVKISFVGYATYNLKIHTTAKEEVDLGEITLQKDDIAIDEVVVTASAVKRSVDKTVLYPTQIQTKSSSNGLELLKNINLPGMLVDPVNQSVQVVGTDKVIYKINGRTVQLRDILTIKPESILRVEYSDTPNARYANENAATINIELKAAENGTVVFADAMSALATGFVNGNASVKSIFGKSEVSVNYALYLRDYKERWAVENEVFSLPHETVTLTKKYNNAPFGYVNHNVNVGYGYNDGKNIFSAKLYNDIFSNFQYSKIDIRRVEDNNDDIFRTIHSHQNQYSPSLDLFYSHDFDKKRGLEFNVVATYNSLDYSRNMSDTYINQSDRKSSIDNSSRNNKKSLIFEGLYYSNANQKLGYSFGVRGNYSYSQNTYDRDNVFGLNYFEIYPYAEISGKINKFGYSVGTGFKINKMNNFSDAREYYRNLTTISLQYAPKSWSIRYRFYYGPSYPSLSDLADVYVRQDNMILIKGNPNLKPSQTLSNTLQLSYINKKIMIYGSLQHRKTFDAINDAVFYDNTKQSVVIERVNQPHTSIFGGRLELVLPSIMEICSFSAGAYIDRYNSVGSNYNHSFTDFYWLVSLNCQYRKFTLSAIYREPQIVMNGIYKELLENMSAINFSYKHNDNLVFKCSWYYPFSSGTKYGSQTITEVLKSSTSRYIRDNNNMVVLGLTYNMNWGKSPFKTNGKLRNADTDKGILKATDH